MNGGFLGVERVCGRGIFGSCPRVLMGDLGALVTCEWSIFGWLGDWLVERLDHWLLVGCLGDGWLVA